MTYHHTKLSRTITVNQHTLHRVLPEDYALFRKYYEQASYEDVTFYSSFPLLLMGRHAWMIADGFLVSFRVIKNQAGAMVAHVKNLPRNEKGEYLDVVSTREILRTINHHEQGSIVHVHPHLHNAYAPSEHMMRTVDANNEYIFDNQLLAAAEGGLCKSLRKNAGRFSKRNNFEIIPYQKDLRIHVDEVYANWRNTHGLKYKEIADEDLYIALLDGYDAINQWIFIVLDKDRNEYIGFFDAILISPQLALGVFRKLSPSYVGILDYCQLWLSRYLADKGIHYFNDGDASTANLRISKEKFHPIYAFVPLQYYCEEQPT